MVDSLSHERFDLVLMDNVMPRMTGVEATAAIRSRERATQQRPSTTAGLAPAAPVRIFGVTGNALSEDVAEFKRAGCDEVLTKPLSLAELKRLLGVYGLLDP